MNQKKIKVKNSHSLNYLTYLTKKYKNKITLTKKYKNKITYLTKKLKN